MPNGRACGESHQRTSEGADRAEHDGTRYRPERSIGAAIPRMSGKGQQGHGQDCEDAEGLHWFLQQGGGHTTAPENKSMRSRRNVAVPSARKLWN
jgi:hypothetical protein